MSDKEAESWYLRWLSELGGGLPEGHIEPFESPDFRIHSPDGVVGIEVTELYHPQEDGEPSPRREQEELRRRALDLAREVHDRSGGRPVQVAVFFSHPLRRRRVGPLGHELADLIGNLRVERGDQRELTKGDPRCPALPEEVDEVSVTHIPGYDRSRWWNPWAARIPTLEPVNLQELLDRKEQRVPAYRLHCDWIWLLVGIDRVPSSKRLTLSQAISSHRFQSTFDRVVVVDNAERRVVDLRLEALVVLAQD